jgi:hypothetical protein
MSTVKNITYTQRFENYVKQLMFNELCKSYAPRGHVEVVSVSTDCFQEGIELYTRLFLD